MAGFLRRIADNLHSNFWNIGFVEESLKEVLQSNTLNVHWMKHSYKDRWFADPFILDVTSDEITVLVEEFTYKLQKGRIAKLVISRDGYELKDMKILLELPTHLSFPVILRKDGVVYVMPENSQSGETKIYCYDEQKELLTEKNVVCHLPLTDATILQAPEGKCYILSTKTPTQNSDTLYVYAFDSETLSANSQPVQEIKFRDNTARNAGDVFMIDGQMYRPAQDCNQWYGSGVTIEKLNYNHGHFESEYLKTFTTRVAPFDMGYHTFNQFNGLIVVDAHGHRYKTANLILNKIGEIRRNRRNMDK